MKRFVLPCLFAAALSSLGVLRAAEPSIDDFFESFTLEWYRGNPQSATWAQCFQGAEQDAADRLLTPVSDEYRDSRVALAKRGLAELRRFDRAKLAPRQRLFAEMLDWQLDDVIRDEVRRDTWFPFDQMSGVQLGLPDFLVKIHPMRTPRDAENFLVRLGQLGPRIDDARVVAETRAAKGFIPPRFILVATIEQMERFMAPAPRDNFLVTSFDARMAKVAGLAPEVRAQNVAAAETLVRDSVLPAYRRVVVQLRGLLSRATDDAGLCRFANGAAAYAQALRSHTSTDLTAQQIHDIGLREVARLEGEMDVLLRKLGFVDGTVKQRMEQLDEQSFYPDEADVRTKILQDYERWLREAEKRCEAMFDLRPKARVEVRRESEFAEKNASANYTMPAQDGSLPGVFRVPLPGPRFPKYPDMRSTTYHETVPGHHFQLALQQEMPDLPRFVRDSTFDGGLSAYIEGWALYAECLADEAGWYEGDIRGRLGFLGMQLLRARRLVVDTGLHAKGWTRQQAIDYGIPANGVERYVVWPGQACSYMIGELKLIELREKARRALGPKFSLKEFHNVILRTGAVPLPLLERVVDDYIRGASSR